LLWFLRNSQQEKHFREEGKIAKYLPCLKGILNPKRTGARAVNA
jgi:hypothetical protein